MLYFILGLLTGIILSAVGLVVLVITTTPGGKR